jgi:hypothetical protein
MLLGKKIYKDESDSKTREKQLLDKLKEKKGCWKSKEEAVYRNL